jgi:hypothetical protein
MGKMSLAFGNTPREPRELLALLVGARVFLEERKKRIHF